MFQMSYSASWGLLLMPWNLTNIATNATSVHGFITGVNEELMFGWLGILFLVALAIIMYTSFIFVTGQDTKKSVMATSFIIAVLSVLFMALNWINQTAFFIFIVGAAVSIAFTYKTS